MMLSDCISNVFVSRHNNWISMNLLEMFLKEAFFVGFLKKNRIFANCFTPQE